MTRVLTSTGPLRKALVLSFAVHGAVFGVVHPRAPSLSPPEAALMPPEDRWTGTTADLPFAGGAAAPLYDVSVEAHPAPAPVPVAAEPAPAAPAAEPMGVAPPPRPAAPVEPPRPPRKPRPRPASSAQPVSASGVASAGESAGGPGGGSFGSEGAASVRDLGRAFTRAIPPACDADPIWASQPTGDTGKLEVAIHIDETGHITGADPRGVDAPKALVSLLRRTLALLQAGIFAVRPGGVGEGTEILELRARVSDAEAGEGVATGLAHEYAQGRGKAAFTQASGRHVEVAVRVARVEAGR